MTEEIRKKANQKKKKKESLLIEFKKVNRMITGLSDTDIIDITVSDRSTDKVFPLATELRTLLITIRDRLDNDIKILDMEFDNLWQN